ncbi:hypothetical protein BO99DRAFT_67295 [Aspergillus violaceofuscus CBS 115571]|uniref:Uncharacterized protein n=1 Tax=Aspergillus violaceofuscus (strain CBS 115571) TaxID=1450538 RepID=A0A2V5GVQ7_ASPV1|nr:hypothetical protein BO99DRAFT_67295 [Aspergillus violaceofuscus CBS 115571]
MRFLSHVHESHRSREDRGLLLYLDPIALAVRRSIHTVLGRQQLRPDSDLYVVPDRLLVLSLHPHCVSVFMI